MKNWYKNQAVVIKCGIYLICSPTKFNTYVLHVGNGSEGAEMLICHSNVSTEDWKGALLHILSTGTVSFAKP